MDTEIEKAVFGAGCFWCVEAVFQQLKGVLKVSSGYTGGKINNPSYKEVCSGLSGHAEVCLVEFNPAIISFEELLEVFWMSHDPTTLNRQGADQGTQYRSAIFYINENQKKLSELYKEKLEKGKVFDKAIVTEITELGNYYPAEDYHQNYFNLNEGAAYCQYVIVPKLEKFKKIFSQKIKD